MRKNMEISSEQFNEIINNFYNYFENGYVFEEFLKSYLEKIGLDEVYVTKRSDDGGIDLTAIRKGIGEFNQADADKYYIQAKRYKPTANISPEKIRALRGSFSNGKGIFITTAKVSDKAKNEANELDPQRPILVVDGRDLVISCIENEIGFVFKPQFSKSAMDDFLNKNRIDTDNIQTKNKIQVEKQISSNDIRARILPIPRAIMEQIDDNIYEYNVCFNDSYTKKLKIDKRRRYFARVTEAYRKFGLIADDGSFKPTNAIWLFSDGNIRIKLN